MRTAADARAEPRASRREDAGGSRERILQAAAALFRRRGYKGATVRDIANEVGILSGSLFYHFRSKEEILLEIMRVAASSNCRDAQSAVASETTPQAQLRALIALELDFTVGGANRDFQTVFYSEWREIPASEQAEFLTYRRAYRSIWRTVLDACHAHGSLRCEPKAAEIVAHASIAGLINRYNPEGRYGLAEMARIIVRLLLADEAETVSPQG